MKTRIPTLLISFGAVIAAALLGMSGPSAAPGTTPAATPAPEGATRAAPGCPALLDLKLPRLQDDAPQDLCRYAGQLILVVNTASFCGFTGQYTGLERLYARYRERGFVVLGFPSNDFGRQEPGSSREIAEVCYNTYGVRFPMFAKSRVIGPDANPVFAALTRQAGAPPGWNFHKYLVGRDGRLVASFQSAIDPLDRRLTEAIERHL